MKKNVGNADKIVRILLAIMLGALYFTGTVSGTVGYAALTLGGIFVLTSAIGFCPIYTIVGINVCPVNKQD